MEKERFWSILSGTRSRRKRSHALTAAERSPKAGKQGTPPSVVGAVVALVAGLGTRYTMFRVHPSEFQGYFPEA